MQKHFQIQGPEYDIKILFLNSFFPLNLSRSLCILGFDSICSTAGLILHSFRILLIWEVLKLHNPRARHRPGVNPNQTSEKCTIESKMAKSQLSFSIRKFSSYSCCAFFVESKNMCTFSIKNIWEHDFCFKKIRPLSTIFSSAFHVAT